ncbi:MAG TPA: trypsin-like peptidase domain-containing protein [Candidatus Paceibacterota bacterium]|jgi:S1-C subfamily serine protease|nr:trypsin-like peptidase domain-containing protein [Candidatus Paceibacterota bacterium]
MEEENKREPKTARRRGKRKIFGIVVLALIAGLCIGVALNAPQAQANGITDFFSQLFSFPALPFGILGSGNAAPAANQSSSVSLYQPVADYENAVVTATKNASPAVVSIIISENVPVVEQCPYNPFEDLPPEFQQFLGNGSSSDMTQPCDTGQTQLQQVGGGSGFIISSDGLILTNKHVVSDASASYTVITNDGTQYNATVLARDPDQDLAVVKIDASNLPTVTLGDSDGLQLGQTAIAIGNALGQFSNTVSVGVVSGLERTVTAQAPDTGAEETIENVIQTDAAINPGNSGGPLLNLEGQVIGINTAIASDAENIGFAIPINQAKHDISSVESTGQIETAYLGVRYIPVTSDIAQQQGLPVDYGALVRGDSTGPGVEPNSPAAKAGVQAEDIITAVNGTSLENNDLAAVVSQYNPGTAVTLTINRAGKTITLQVTLGTRPAGS